MISLLWFVVGAAVGAVVSRYLLFPRRPTGPTEVTLSFDGTDIDADPDTVEVDYQDTLTFKTKNGKADDKVTIEFLEKKKGSKKVKGPFPGRANDPKNPRRGVYEMGGSESLTTDPPDENPGPGKYACWKYSVTWTRGMTPPVKLDPDVMIKGGN
jgi:hypothetical protein